MLDPALMLISEALRKDPNLRKYLHGGSFASNAMVYRHRASPRDHDLATARRTTFSHRNPWVPPGLGPRTPHHSADARTSKTAKTYSYGYCFRFQHTNNCDRPACNFIHKCHKCNGTSHTETSCPEK